MGVFENLGIAFGTALSHMVQSTLKGLHDIQTAVQAWIGWHDSIIQDIDVQLVKRSIGKEMFKSKEFQDFAEELKKKLATSPDSLVDWLRTSYLNVMGILYDGMIALLIPQPSKDFATAKQNAGHVTMLAADFVILTAALDVVATAMSATLIRNIIHVGRMFIGTFGLDRYVSAVIAPALEPGLVNPLRYGWNEQFQTTMPPIQDVIRFTVREVYDPARRSELLSVPTPSKAYEFSRKHGFSDSITDDYWAAHWVLPAINDLNQMLHRRIIDPAKWKRYVTLNDYEPTMIDNFKKIIYYPYTRVDVRRMYEYGVLESKQVEDTYLDLGYDTEHARNLAIFAKSIVAIPVIKARYSKGWITGNQVKEELLKTGMTATKAEEIYQTIVAAEKTTRVTAERDLTKAEIVKGVKKGVISIDEGVSLLQDMGYDQFESQYILAINLEAASGSPETPFEFKNIIAKYRQAVGQSAEILPENILALERELIAARKELESQKEFKVADELLAAQAKEVSDLEKKLRDELQRIRSTPIPQK